MLRTEILAQEEVRKSKNQTDLGVSSALEVSRRPNSWKRRIYRIMTRLAEFQVDENPEEWISFKLRNENFASEIWFCFFVFMFLCFYVFMVLCFYVFMLLWFYGFMNQLNQPAVRQAL
jgi:hypothetical protein